MSTEYDDQFPLMAVEDLRRGLLALKGQWQQNTPNKITLYDVTKACKIHRARLDHFINNTSNNTIWGRLRFTPLLHRRLSQFVIRVQCGMITKKLGKLIYHAKPTKPMPIVRKVSLGLDGPRLTVGRQMDAPKLMPHFSDVFRVKKTINLPKWK